MRRWLNRDRGRPARGRSVERGQLLLLDLEPSVLIERGPSAVKRKAGGAAQQLSAKVFLRRHEVLRFELPGTKNQDLNSPASMKLGGISYGTGIPD
jgi:hypothetical protein